MAVVAFFIFLLRSGGSPFTSPPSLRARGAAARRFPPALACSRRRFVLTFANWVPHGNMRKRGAPVGISAHIAPFSRKLDTRAPRRALTGPWNGPGLACVRRPVIRKERTMHSVGFIGGGRIARILIGGWARKGLGPVTVLVHEPDGAAFDALTGVAPRVQRASALEAAAAPVVFVALHPPAIAAALAALRPAIRPDTILVSLAPKITLAALSDRTGTSRVARMIPNAPSLLGLGYNPVTYGEGLDWHGRGALSALFSPWGDAPEVEESTLEAYALV